jgi:hypothetical protein
MDLTPDMIRRLPRSALLRLLAGAGALPDWRCTAHLRDALAGAVKRGTIPTAVVLQEFNDENAN